MRKSSASFYLSIFLLIGIFSLTGCTFILQKGTRKDVEKINQLENKLTALERAKAELEGRLKGEIDNKQVKVEMLERGLVITFVAEVLFNSGKSDLRSGALGTLDQVSYVLDTTVKDLNVGIEGHTDNVPIKHSGWKSNWELSSARAMSVLHYLVDEKGIAPVRLAATGYGEYQPVDSNDTKEGRQKNRRVEIVILPRTLKEPGAAVSIPVVQEENLK